MTFHKLNLYNSAFSIVPHANRSEGTVLIKFMPYSNGFSENSGMVFFILKIRY
jgi:hypothetical protein